ncbi:hypothetical protein CY34DRAFT_16788 [Suillus luteus UH-Slu-Lm8-n1]|uniref:Uncharacterized protein n=1 Tax=Suillus luteus UH-Slu-Lm8-n1 TaxID=930992 RepID=A0A0D0A250_9AGAM|nr:hypothetical protein CY34DRAFT_16788 [Suillus luteus UH-Slu-Lm8-n1]
MSNSNQLRDSSPVTSTRGRSVQPRNKVRRFLTKVKDGLTTKISRSSSRSRHPILPNADPEDASLVPNIEVQDASGVEQGADPQSVLRDAKKAVKGMNLLSGPLGSGLSAAQNAPADLEDAYNFQDTYLQPLRIFDNVISKLADVHPYAKIALGVLSCASKESSV